MVPVRSVLSFVIGISGLTTFLWNDCLWSRNTPLLSPSSIGPHCPPVNPVLPIFSRICVPTVYWTLNNLFDIINQLFSDEKNGQVPHPFGMPSKHCPSPMHVRRHESENNDTKFPAAGRDRAKLSVASVGTQEET